MKITVLISLLATCAGPLCAQSPQATGSPTPFPPASGPAGDQMRERFRDKMMENLPPEIRARFEAAREKAMQDPSIQELKKTADTASEAFRKAMREAIIKADPGLAEIIKERVKDKMKMGKAGEPPGLANLSEGDRQKLMAAREKAKSDPAVVAARPDSRSDQTAPTPDCCSGIIPPAAAIGKFWQGGAGALRASGFESPPDRKPARLQVGFGLVNGELSEMKNAGGKDGIC